MEELDRGLNGLFWGDNVVFAADDAADVEPFFLAVAAQLALYEAAAFVTLVRDPDELSRAYPGLDVIDAREGSALAQPRPLLDAIAARCAGSPRQLLLFDSLEAMSDRWGRETAGRFFSRGCPLLLGLGAIAYWSLPAAGHAPTLRREIEGITQCVFVVGDGRLRIAKAEGRPPGVEGSVYRYTLEEGLPVLAAAPAAARLGAALRSLRISRHLSQADLARLAGVSASAISQAERGRRGLSLETLLDLAAKLNITLDELLRGDVAPGYRLARRDDPRHAETDRPVPLLDDPRAGLRVYLDPPLAGRQRDARLRPQGRRGRQRRHRARTGAARLGRAGAPAGRGVDRRPQRRQRLAQPRATERRSCSGSCTTTPP